MLILLCAAVFSISCKSGTQQTFDSADGPLIPFLKDNLYGYSRLDGSIVINPLFDEAEFFDSLGFARVRRDSSWMLIDRSGHSCEITRSSMFLPVVSTYSNNSNRPIGNLKYFYTRTGIVFHNTKSGSRTEEFRRTPIHGGLDQRQPTFVNGLFVGKSMAGDHCVIDTSGEIVLRSEGQPMTISETFVSYPISKRQVALYNRANGSTMRFPFSKILSVFNDSLFIVECHPDSWTTIPTALVSHKKVKQGLVNKKGKLLIDTIYNSLERFSSKLLIAEKSNFYQLIRTDGSRIDTLQYRNFFRLSAEHHAAELPDGTTVILNNEGVRDSDRWYNWIYYDYRLGKIRFHRDGMAGVMTSNFVVEIEYPADNIEPISNRQFYLITINERQGLVNSEGEMIIPADYQFIEINSPGFIHLKKEGKTGLADLAGNILFEAVFDDIKVTGDDPNYLFWPKKDGFYGCYDTDVNQIQDFVLLSYIHGNSPINWIRQGEMFQYLTRYGRPIGLLSENIRSVYAGVDSVMLAVITRDSLQYLLRENGAYLAGNGDKKIIKGISPWNFRSGLFTVHTSKGVGVINQLGKWILKPGSRRIHSMTDHLIASEENGLYWFYDHGGKLIHSEPFNNILGSDRTQGYRVVRYVDNDSVDSGSHDINNRYGFMNAKGKIVVPLKYHELSRAHHGYMFASFTSSKGEQISAVIDTLGNHVLEVACEWIRPFGDPIQEHVYRVRKDNYTGLIHLSGRWIITPNLNSVSFSIDTTFFMINDTTGEWKLIDNYERIIYSNITDYRPAHEHYDRINDDLVLIYPNGRSVLLNRSGDILHSFDTYDVQRVQHRDLSLLEINSAGQKYYYNYLLDVEYRSGSDKM